jgi:hypothetical protein
LFFENKKLKAKMKNEMAKPDLILTTKNSKKVIEKTKYNII